MEGVSFFLSLLIGSKPIFEIFVSVLAIAIPTAGLIWVTKWQNRINVVIQTEINRYENLKKSVTEYHEGIANAIVYAENKNISSLLGEKTKILRLGEKIVLDLDSTKDEENILIKMIEKFTGECLDMTPQNNKAGYFLLQSKEISDSLKQIIQDNWNGVKLELRYKNRGKRYSIPLTKTNYNKIKALSLKRNETFDKTIEYLLLSEINNPENLLMQKEDKKWVNL